MTITIAHNLVAGATCPVPVPLRGEGRDGSARNAALASRVRGSNGLGLQLWLPLTRDAGDAAHTVVPALSPLSAEMGRGSP